MERTEKEPRNFEKLAPQIGRKNAKIHSLNFFQLNAQWSFTEVKYQIRLPDPSLSPNPWFTFYLEKRSFAMHSALKMEIINVSEGGCTIT